MVTKLPLKKRLRIQISEIIDKTRVSAFCSRGFRVLLYHSVTEKFVENEWEESTIHKELFEQQMEYLLKERYRIISCKDAVALPETRSAMPSRTVSISFDDGYRDSYANALPILKKYNIPATFFLTVGLLCDYSKNPLYLSQADIRDIKRLGCIDFGCHGLTHKILTMLDEKGLDDEIVGAKQKMEELTEGKITLFAYPFGHSASYNERVVEKIQGAGFQGAFTTTHGVNDLRRNKFLLRRNPISWLDEMHEFKKHLNGSYDWCSVAERFRRKRYA